MSDGTYCILISAYLRRFGVRQRGTGGALIFQQRRSPTWKPVADEPNGRRVPRSHGQWAFSLAVALGNDVLLGSRCNSRWCGIECYCRFFCCYCCSMNSDSSRWSGTGEWFVTADTRKRASAQSSLYPKYEKRRTGGGGRGAKSQRCTFRTEEGSVGEKIRKREKKKSSIGQSEIYGETSGENSAIRPYARRTGNWDELRAEP